MKDWNTRERKEGKNIQQEGRRKQIIGVCRLDLQCECVHQTPISPSRCLRAALKAACAFLTSSVSVLVLRKRTVHKLHFPRRHLDSKYDCAPSESTLYEHPWHNLGTVQQQGVIKGCEPTPSSFLPWDPDSRVNPELHLHNSQFPSWLV